MVVYKISFKKHARYTPQQQQTYQALCWISLVRTLRDFKPVQKEGMEMEGGPCSIFEEPGSCPKAEVDVMSLSAS